MGFSSFLTSDKKQSIPAYPYAEKPASLSHIVVILPDDSTHTGFYTGYGAIQPSKDYVAYSDSKNPSRTPTAYALSQETAISLWDLVKPFLKEGESEFVQYINILKVVRFEDYHGQLWSELAPIEDCPDQGFFY